MNHFLRGPSKGVFHAPSTSRLTVFVSLHFPFADVRRYVADAPVAAWPPNPNRDFIRGFGRARERATTRATRVPGEDVYCDARRALRFEPFLARRRIGAASGGLLPYCGHRRLLGDGLGAMRLEVGIGSYAAAAPRGLGGEGLLDILQHIFALPVTVHRLDGVRKVQLVRASGALARAFVSATSREAATGEGWWVTAGRPLCMVTFDPVVEVTSLPAGASEIASVALSPKSTLANHPPTSCSIAHLNVQYLGTTVRLVLMGIRKPRRVDQDQLRRLRVHLARTHTERECLKQVLSLIEQDRLSVGPSNTAGRRLEDYLSAVFSRLQRPTFDGFPQESIVRGMEDGQDCITEEQRTAIMERLRDAKADVRRAAHGALIGGQSPEGPTFTVQSGTIEVTYVQNNTGIVGGQGNQVVSAQTISGTVVNGIIRDSFNTIASSDAAPTLKEELSKLASTVEEMTAKLDAQKAAAVARDLRTMTEEAVDPKPRRGAFDVSAAGLLEAASFVGDFSTRIAASLAAVAKLIFI